MARTAPVPAALLLGGAAPSWFTALGALRIPALAYLTAISGMPTRGFAVVMLAAAATTALWKAPRGWPSDAGSRLYFALISVATVLGVLTYSLSTRCWLTPLILSVTALVGLVDVMHVREARRHAEATAVRTADLLAELEAQRHAAIALRDTVGRDALTGLPNRSLFLKRLEAALGAASRHTGSHIAVLFVDCDRFKLVNDTLGHAGGDLLLTAFAKRIEACVRPSDTVARLGGDEFVVLMNNLDAATSALYADDHVDTSIASFAATRILQALHRPFKINDTELVVGASIGVAFNAPNITVEEIVSNADVAMYHAKSRGKGRYEIFSPDLRAKPQEDADMSSAIVPLPERRLVTRRTDVDRRAS